MATVNKIVYGDEVLLDLSSDTVEQDVLLSGYKAHNKAGVLIDGTLVINKVYTGADDPSPSLGIVGDIYIKV